MLSKQDTDKALANLSISLNSLVHRDITYAIIKMTRMQSLRDETTNTAACCTNNVSETAAVKHESGSQISWNFPDSQTTQPLSPEVSPSHTRFKSKLHVSENITHPLNLSSTTNDAASTTSWSEILFIDEASVAGGSAGFAVSETVSPLHNNNGSFLDNTSCDAIDDIEHATTIRFDDSDVVHGGCIQPVVMFNSKIHKAAIKRELNEFGEKIELKQGFYFQCIIIFLLYKIDKKKGKFCNCVFSKRELDWEIRWIV